jgi:hypothetical protein
MIYETAARTVTFLIFPEGDASMEFSSILSTKQRLFVISSIVLGCLLLSTAVLSASGRRGQREVSSPSVIDKTGSLNLLSQERIDRRFETRMQNTFNKSITAYVTAVCDTPESSTDFAIGDHSIEPGGIVEITTPVATLSNMCGSAITHPTITILAVVFDDRTSRGEFRFAKGVLDNRRGNRIQLKRINGLLTKALKWPDADKPTAIERLRDQIASLPVNEEVDSTVRGGLSDAKQRALHLLDELQQWHQNSLNSQSRQNIPVRGELAGIDNLRKGLEKLITLNEKWISRY